MKEKAEQYFLNWMLKSFNEGNVEGAKELPKIKEVFCFRGQWYASFHGGYDLTATENEILYFLRNLE